jgi:peptidoglycan LD-endopeptidase LytH
MHKKFVLITFLVAVGTAVIYLFFALRPDNARRVQVFAWMRNPAARPDLKMQAGARCGDAPFIFPTDGLVGFLWDDSFGIGHRHQGIDIFAGAGLGTTRVIAAYPGYLSRLPDWRSSVIVRVPSDPLEPRRQIWVYYTHMADEQGNSFISGEFPPGTVDKLVEAGTFLGYQGDYSGDPNNPTGIHLHVSVVEDDGFGRFKNELDINNTYDPSPYFGLPLNANENTSEIPLCQD